MDRACSCFLAVADLKTLTVMGRVEGAMKEPFLY